MILEYVLLGVILAVALCFFWTQKLRMDVTALGVMLALIVPWPHPPDGRWRGISPRGRLLGLAAWRSSWWRPCSCLALRWPDRRDGGDGLGAIRPAPQAAGPAIGRAQGRPRWFRCCQRHHRRRHFMPLIWRCAGNAGSRPRATCCWRPTGRCWAANGRSSGGRSNVIVGDILRQRTGEGIGFLDFAGGGGGFAVCLAGFVWYGRRFLPKADESRRLGSLARNYLTEAMVTPQSGGIGKTVAELAARLVAN